MDSQKENGSIFSYQNLLRLEDRVSEIFLRYPWIGWGVWIVFCINSLLRNDPKPLRLDLPGLSRRRARLLERAHDLRHVDARRVSLLAGVAAGARAAADDAAGGRGGDRHGDIGGAFVHRRLCLHEAAAAGAEPPRCHQPRRRAVDDQHPGRLVQSEIRAGSGRHDRLHDAGGGGDRAAALGAGVRCGCSSASSPSRCRW